MDTVDKLVYGRPIKTLATGLAADVLRNRRRCGQVWAPAPEHELITLLLHATLDKGRFDPRRADRLQYLITELGDGAAVAPLLAEYWVPGASWDTLCRQIAAGEWSALLAQAPAVAERLRQRDPMGTRLRDVKNRAWRTLSRLSGAVRPAVPSVAVLGPDGAEIDRRGRNSPLVTVSGAACLHGAVLEEARQRGAGKLPGVGFAGLLLTQWKRYLTARYHQGSGRLVIFDRYAYDALLPSSRR